MIKMHKNCFVIYVFSLFFDYFQLFLIKYLTIYIYIYIYNVMYTFLPTAESIHFSFLGGTRI